MTAPKALLTPVASYDMNSPEASSKYPARITPHFVAEILAHALAEGHCDKSHETVIFYDLERLDDTMAALKAAFPATTLHAIAVKANPSVEILKRIHLAGNGAEVASAGEIQLALSAGIPPEHIAFDSPVKTNEELKYALDTGLRINANSINELERLYSLSITRTLRPTIGIRINSEVGFGSIIETSVSTPNSKFGIPLSIGRARISKLLRDYPWISTIHTHVGSQGILPDKLLSGIGQVYDTIMDIDSRGQITCFDIGGGLPTSYKNVSTSITFEEYADALAVRCPNLFRPEFSIVTEFGRSVHANNGWVASKIEYVLNTGPTKTLVAHVGADMFLRTAYSPSQWSHSISICDSDGHLRCGNPAFFDVAGPLCFSGDYLARNIPLPKDTQEGDYVIVHDAGAYTFGMWSIYNSRQFPLMIGYQRRDNIFRNLRRQQTLDEIVAAWSS